MRLRRRACERLDIVARTRSAACGRRRSRDVDQHLLAHVDAAFERGRAHVRQQHHALELEQLGIEPAARARRRRGPAPASVARLQHADARILVDHLAARGLTMMAVGSSASAAARERWKSRACGAIDRTMSCAPASGRALPWLPRARARSRRGRACGCDSGWQARSRALAARRAWPMRPCDDAHCRLPTAWRPASRSGSNRSNDSHAHALALAHAPRRCQTSAMSCRRCPRSAPCVLVTVMPRWRRVARSIWSTPGADERSASAAGPATARGCRASVTGGTSTSAVLHRLDELGGAQRLFRRHDRVSNSSIAASRSHPAASG